MELTTTGPDLQAIGELANYYAQQTVFSNYQMGAAENTLRAQRCDLEHFSLFLRGLDPQAPGGEDLYTNPKAWKWITWGLVEAYQNSCLRDGFSVATVNRRVTTIHRYAELAFAAGCLDQDNYLRIGNVKAIPAKRKRHIDAKRPVSRLGAKKPQSNRLNPAQAATLKAQDELSPQGRRDRLLMCLLLDHGLRIGEIVLLHRNQFDLSAGTMTFDRPKVDKVQTHKLSMDTLAALRSYIDSGDCPSDDSLWRGSRRDGNLVESTGISTRALADRVKCLGVGVGFENLSPHDCRHYWATYWSKRVDIATLQQAGGWTSLSTVQRYIDLNEIANEGMI